MKCPHISAHFLPWTVLLVPKPVINGPNHKYQSPSNITASIEECFLKLSSPLNSICGFFTIFITRKISDSILFHISPYCQCLLISPFMTFPLYSLSTILLKKTPSLHPFSLQLHFLSKLFHCFPAFSVASARWAKKAPVPYSIYSTCSNSYSQKYVTNNYLAVLTRQVLHGTACPSSLLVFLCFTSGDTAIFATQISFRHVFVIKIPQHNSNHFYCFFLFKVLLSTLHSSAEFPINVHPLYRKANSSLLRV